MGLWLGCFADIRRTGRWVWVQRSGWMQKCGITQVNALPLCENGAIVLLSRISPLTRWTSMKLDFVYSDSGDTIEVLTKILEHFNFDFLTFRISLGDWQVPIHDMDWTIPTAVFFGNEFQWVYICTDEKPRNFLVSLFTFRFWDMKHMIWSIMRRSYCEYQQVPFF